MNLTFDTGKAFKINQNQFKFMTIFAGHIDGTKNEVDGSSSITDQNELKLHITWSD